MDTKQFLSKFDHITSATGGVQRIRELVLQLAVSGRLVQREQNEATAESALLEAEFLKTQIGAGLKLRHSKPYLPLRESEYPYKIPDHWQWTRLEQIACYIQRGKQPSYVDSGTVLVVSQKCIQWTGFDLSVVRYTDEASLNGYEKERFLLSGDLLWNSTGTGTVGRVALYDEDPIVKAVTDSHVTIIRLSNFIPRYVWSVLASPWVQSMIVPGHKNSIVTGTTKQVELATRSVRALAIPCPPIEEQKRIVAKVDELMALCDKLEAQQQEREALCKLVRTITMAALTDAQSSSTLHLSWQRLENAMPVLLTDSGSASELTTAIKSLALRGFLTERGSGNANELLRLADAEKSQLIHQGRIPKIKGLLPITQVPYELPSNWQWARLHQIAEVIDPNPSHRMPNYVAHGVPFISTENLTDYDQINFSMSKQVSKEVLAEHTSRYEIRDGTFAFSRIGTIGKTCHLPKQRTYCISHVLVVISPLTKKIDEKYLRLTISAESTLKQALEGVKSIGVPDLGMAKIRNFLLPIPPLEEQLRIVEKIDRLIGICNSLEASINTAKSIARDFASNSVASITGIQVEDKEKMKAPKTELISTLRIGVSPTNREQAPLAAILIRNNGEMPAKTLWQNSGDEIDVFYQQLKTEMAKGWIVQPEIAHMREMEVS